MSALGVIANAVLGYYVPVLTVIHTTVTCPVGPMAPPPMGPPPSGPPGGGPPGS